MRFIHLQAINLLFMLLVFVLVGAVLGSLLGLLAGAILTGNTSIDALFSALDQSTSNTKLLLVVQGFSSLGMFAFPPIALGLYEKDTWKYVVRTGQVDFRLFFLTLLITLGFSPLSELLGQWNQQIKLPVQFQALEEWMQQMERQMEELTLMLLSDVSLGGFLLNFLIIAMVAAVGEELLFRGALQTIFLRWIRNPHVAILLVAFIFSAIHMQFYGFFPRLALGLLFGYLFYWSNNLWIPIFAHLVNNGAVVINTFIYQRQGNELSSLELSVSIPTFTYYISAIVVIYALLAFRNHTNQLQNLSTTKQTIL
jgi:membrane protease YdiL (CAAX protease family)